jgi:leucyl-tRNA synthetase
MKPYDPNAIEEKWLASWEKSKLFQDTAKHLSKSDKEKFYALFAFAYPSGSGLHVGHVESKTALDILVRFLRMNGKDVFFPVGWDAFGLPAENYAIKTGIHPSVTTKDAITTFRRQIKRIGISYDWETELATCHPEYYKWTQWIFTKLFQAGLAYRDKGWVNWCPQDKTVLANEQVVNGECERCGSKVIQKELEQWKFRISSYQDELLSGLDQVDWPKATKEQQVNWIGRSEGAEVRFQVKGEEERENTYLSCFTTRLDTIHGVTFLVISPEKFKEMNLIEHVGASFVTPVKNYLDASFHKTEEQRRVGEKEKTGVDTHIKVFHPLTGDEIPLWIADYVLAGYGTGVVMGVPSLDERDRAFAKKFDLPVIEIEVLSDAETQELLSIHPDRFATKTTYKLRDWLISRQRYWGAPIPMTLCEQCGWQAVPEEQLPVLLPEIDDFTPTDDGKSPLEKANSDWLYTKCPSCGGQAKREVDTMDTFVDSSWYFLRYASRNLSDQIFEKELTQKLLPVDLYLIGPEHIVLHLLYARFFSKFLRDQGYLTFDEPFMKMRHQGMILGPDGKKMSKSKGNVINPDEIIEKFGADSLRVYEMFMGPLDADKAWDTNSLVGIYRFLRRVHDLVLSGKKVDRTPEILQKKLHQTIQKLTQDIPKLKFNTAIAAMMEYINLWESTAEASKEDTVIFVQLVAPFAPFLAEELWSELGKEGSIHQSSWPTADLPLLVEPEVEIVVQVNGKVRGKFTISRDASEDQIKEHAVALTKQKPKKIIVVPGKLVNLVV